MTEPWGLEKNASAFFDLSLLETFYHRSFSQVKKFG